jgi:hypothetical protein
MTKNYYSISRYCYIIRSTGGAVQEVQVADPEDVGSIPACVLKFTKSWRAKRKITHFTKLYAISA